MLDGVEGMFRLVEVVASQVTDTIWLGKMNAIQRRVDPTIQGVIQAVALIQNQQSDTNIRRLYSMLKGNGKIRWKDSLKDVLRRNTDFVD
jgi:hypothetical protein